MTTTQTQTQYNSNIDTTKLSTFVDCPRKYFFEYELGWRPELTDHNLIFGEAWHAALATLYQIGNEPLGGMAPIDIAYVSFLDVYRQHFQEHTDDMYAPKSPYLAYEALQNYIDVYFSKDVTTYEVQHIEAVGYVSIELIGEEPRDPAKLYFRQDLIARNRNDGTIVSIEHKTTGRADRKWYQQWQLSLQVGTYTHALYFLYRLADVYGVVINGVVFNKKGPELIRIPCVKILPQMYSWYETVRYYLTALHHEKQVLSQCAEGDSYLRAFPMNPNSCTKYFGCRYHDFCCAWSNPLRYAHEPPLGFKVDFWNPADQPKKQTIDIIGKMIYE